MMTRRSSSAGFTLLELLLSIGLLSMLLAGMYQLMDSWLQRAANRVAAADMMRVQNAAQDYVLANFEPLKAEPDGVFVEMDIEDLKEGNYLPTGYQPRNNFRQRIRVFRRNIEVDRLNPDGTVSLNEDGSNARITTIEVLTASDNMPGSVIRIANKRLLDTAQAGGPKMGVISNAVLPGTTFSGLVTSVFNEWYVPLTAINSAGYNATPDSLGGYLAVYGLVNAEKTDVNDKWLYRVTIDNRPELNRMATDLHMNSNRMENVGSFVADRVNVTGDVTFRGKSQGTTNETSQAMTVEQALRIDGAGESRINMRSTDDTVCDFVDAGGGNRTVSGGCAVGNVAGGELQVVSGPTNAIMTIGTMTADVDQVTDSHGISTFENVNGQDMNVSTTLLAPTTIVTGNSVTTEQMQTATMSVTNGASIGTAGLGSPNKLFAAQVNPGGTLGGPSRTLRTTQMDIGGTADIQGNLISNGLNATTELYLTSVAPAGYRDPALGGRTVVCNVTSGRTYCEPNGVTTWNAGQFIESCTIDTASYSCTHRRRIVDGSYPYYGACRHNRRTGASGQAYHQTVCTSCPAGGPCTPPPQS